jgi:hypothetical protein
MAPVSAFTPSGATRGGVRRAGAAPRLASVTPIPRPRQGRASVAHQIKVQRRGYARAVLQGVRTYRGRPTSQIQKVLQQSLGPLGVRLSALQAREIAEHIGAGRPVELP